MKVNFYNDGPVEIHYEHFAIYKKDALGICGSYDDMFNAWRDESTPNPIRRLLIRDLLRQGLYDLDGDERSCHKITKGYYLRLLYVNKGYDLYVALRNRPELLTEVVEEVIYNLDCGILANWTWRNDPTELIEFLLNFVDSDVGNQLLQYHPAKQKSLPTSARVKRLFDLWRTPKNMVHMPEWLRDDLWSDIEAAVCAEIADYRSEMMANGTYYVGHFSTGKEFSVPPVLAKVFKFIRGCCFDIPNELDYVTQCFELLEANVPEGVAYCYCIGEVYDAVMKFRSNDLILKFARRHLPRDLSSFVMSEWGMVVSSSPSGRVFMHWLHGMIMTYADRNERLVQDARNVILALSGNRDEAWLDPLD